MTSTDELSILRQRYTRVLAIASIILGVIGLLSALLGNVNARPVLSLIGFILVSGLWLALVNSERWQIASYGVLITFAVAALLVPLDNLLMIGLLALVTAAAIASARIYVAVNVLVIGKVAFEAIRRVLETPGMLPADIYNIILMLIALTFVSIVMRYFINGGQRAVIRSRSTAALLQATSEVGQSLSQILDLNDLLERAVHLISTRFQHYHVQIFLVSDARDQVVLVASTGEVGKRLLERGHQLSVGSQSVIGQVVLRSAPVLVSDTKRDPIYYQNDLLLNTRSEMALPIRDGSQTIGALDIQSVYAHAFDQIDLQALQVVADLLATAIRNARLFKQQAETVQENQRLLQDSETNLLEIQRLNQQLTRVAWQNYHTDAQAVTGVTLERDRLLSADDWSEPLRRAGQEGQMIESEGKTVAVPVILRGEVIGAIEVDAGTENSAETAEMVQAVAQRLALSLENARLYEATLQAAAQEQRINDIAARFQSVATVDELLRITLAELSETLGAETGSVRLGRVEQNGSVHHD